MEDLHYAGGLPAVIKEISSLVDLDAPTVTGHPLRAAVATAECFNREVIRPADRPLRPDSGIWVLSGNLCPQGALMKPSAASPALLRHEGPAIVFESVEDLQARIDDPELEVDENAILVLKGCGPRGYPGMPEVGNMPLPRRMLQQGVADMVRISDARMSGTAFGTVVLHVAPESEAGGPLAIVRTGDRIRLDGPARRLELLVPDSEIASRLAAWKSAQRPPRFTRGYYRLYVDNVEQADRGCDFGFLAGGSGDVVERESH